MLAVRVFKASHVLRSAIFSGSVRRQSLVLPLQWDFPFMCAKHVDLDQRYVCKPMWLYPNSKNAVRVETL